MSAVTIPLACPHITAAERTLVMQVLETAQLSRGPMVQAFERCFAEALQVRHAVAVSSGSAALHLALLAAGVQPGQVVVTSPFTVPATANMIVAAGAKVRFCDIEITSLGMDPMAAAAVIDQDVAAMIPVHAFGMPARLTELLALAEKSGVALIEDSCEALGSSYRGRPAGSLGLAGCFGFYPNKQLVTGEGGMLVTNDEAIAGRVRLLRNHGRSMDGQWLDQQLKGWNYRLAELPAALGLAQIRRLAAIQEIRARHARFYHDQLADCTSVQWLAAPADDSVCRFALVVRLTESGQRSAVADRLAQQGIQTGSYFAPLHLQPAWRDLGYARGDFPITEAVSATTLALPFFNTMSRQQIARVCSCLRQAVAAG